MILESFRKIANLQDATDVVGRRGIQKTNVVERFEGRAIEAACQVECFDNPSQELGPMTNSGMQSRREKADTANLCQRSYQSTRTYCKPMLFLAAIVITPRPMSF
jgi:hypothetical protein